MSINSPIQEKTASRVETFTRIFSIVSITIGITGIIWAFAFLQTTQTTTNNANTVAVANTTVVPTPINGCKTISTAGNYILATDIAGTAPCLQIKNTAGITIDGNNKSITATPPTPTSTTTESIYITNSNHITISNLITTNQITVSGDSSDFVTLDHITSTKGIYNVGGDDLTLKDSAVASFKNEPEASSPMERITLLRNTFKSDVQKLVYLANPAASVTPTAYTCTRGDYDIENNYFETSALGGDEPLLLTVRCTTFAKILNNTFVATGSATGIYLRDQSNNHTITGNTFKLNKGWGALYTATGLEACTIVDGKGCKALRPDPGDPSNLTFSNNTVNNTSAPGVQLQAYGTGNVISNNVIRFGGAGQLTGLETTNLWSGTNNTFVHNTVYRNDPGEAMKFDKLGTPANIIRDNIFSTVSASPYSFDHILNNTELIARYVGDHNIFHNRSGAVAFKLPNTQTTASFTSWKTLATGFETNSLESNPLFSNSAITTDLTVMDFAIKQPAPGAALVAGTYSPAYKAASDGTDIGATVTATPPVADTIPPTVSITSPVNRQTLKGASAQVVVSATDNVGVAGVTLYRNGQPFGAEDTSTPYTFTWDISKEGGFVLRNLSAVARDAAGNVTTAPNITVIINQM